MAGCMNLHLGHRVWLVKFSLKRGRLTALMVILKKFDGPPGQGNLSKRSS